jgi:hypothetical protein
MRASDCIFCKIVAGTSDSHEIYRDETTWRLWTFIRQMTGIVW